MKREMSSVETEILSIEKITMKLPDFCPSSSELCLECK